MPQSVEGHGGRLAQLGERHVRNVEVGGSNPLPSTFSLFLSYAVGILQADRLRTKVGPHEAIILLFFTTERSFVSGDPVLCDSIDNIMVFVVVDIEVKRLRGLEGIFQDLTG